VKNIASSPGSRLTLGFAKRITRIYGLALICLGPHVGGLAQQPALSFRGYVVTRTGTNSTAPVSRASVSGGAKTKTVVETDTDGFFNMPLVSAVREGDLVRIHIEKLGFAPYDKETPFSSQATPRFELIPMSKVPSSPQGSDSAKIRQPKNESKAEAKPTAGQQPTPVPAVEVGDNATYISHDSTFLNFPQVVHETGHAHVEMDNTVSIGPGATTKCPGVECVVGYRNSPQSEPQPGLQGGKCRVEHEALVDCTDAEIIQWGGNLSLRD
jgi:hypothetical protein